MVDTDDIRRTTTDRRQTTPQVWHKLPTGELKNMTLHVAVVLFYLCLLAILIQRYYERNKLLCLNYAKSLKTEITRKHKKVEILHDFKAVLKIIFYLICFL